MPQVLNVYALPTLADPEDLRGGTAVVIDVLRWTTTVVHAFAAEAAEVIPCEEIDEARARAAELPREKVVLAGERHGRKIDGFDLGNSPAEYAPANIEGKTIVMTTTNGTRAMARARAAAHVLIAAFVNASAVVARLSGQEQIHLICAGTERRLAEDDTLLAGMLVERLQRAGGMAYELNAQAIAARENWLHSFALPQALGAEPLPQDLLAELLFGSSAGKILTALGRAEDIFMAAQVDRFDHVPELDPQTLRIVGRMGKEGIGD
jgi:2-phosphosulfolactate phosphatase